MAGSRAARAHRFFCCQLTSWECFPPLWLLFSPDFFELALLQCLLPSEKGSAPLSPLGTGAVTGFCVPGMSSYSRKGEFCVLRKPGWALWGWGSSMPSAPLTAEEALELCRFPPGKLFPQCVSKAEQVTLGLSSIPLGRTGTRDV